MVVSEYDMNDHNNEKKNVFLPIVVYTIKWSSGNTHCS